MHVDVRTIDQNKQSHFHQERLGPESFWEYNDIQPVDTWAPGDSNVVAFLLCCGVRTR